ncbi:MAG: endonuclease/exonuclease/phosphatase family protein [Acidimicrobiales bacterium]
MAAPPPSPTASTLVVATFNLHAGVDGWGRPFDVVAACRGIDADVLVLEETWDPDEGLGLAAQIGAELGYHVVEHALAGGRRAGPDPGADHRWMRPLDWRGSSHAIYLDSERPLEPGVVRTPRYAQATTGRWGIAVLSRHPPARAEVLTLGRLPRDRSQRAAVIVEVAVGEHLLTVVGTHMSHLSHGSPLQFLRLNRLLEDRCGSAPAVLAGDMNLWGPPVTILFRRWRRALRRRTWPAWRPHSQVDHVLVRGPVRVLAAEVLPMAGSDHRPVRARLAVGDEG